MAKSNLWSEQNKKKFAVGAVAVCGLVIIYQFFFSGGPSRKPAQSNAARPSATPAPAVTPTPKSVQVIRPDSAAAKEALLLQQLSDTSPLMLTAQRPPAGAETERGNISAYYVPPPPTPTPTPPPPPILLRSVQPPSAVAGTPRAVSMLVIGEHFPPDAQIIYGGSPKPTKRTEAALIAEIPASDYSFARTVPIEVKSQSKPAELYSNQLSFVIQAPPQIPFKMVGRIGDLAVLEFPGTPNKEYIKFHKGEMVMQFWRIDSIDSSGIDVTDTRYDIKARVRFEERR